MAAILMLGASGVSVPSEATVPSASPEATASSARAARTSIALADRIADIDYYTEDGDHEPDVVDYPAADLEKAWFHHRRRAVTVVARFSVLRRPVALSEASPRRPDRNIQTIRFATSRWPRMGKASIDLYPQEDGSVRIDANLDVGELAGEVKPLPCGRTRPTARMNYTRDFYTLRVPRTCLRSPRWVKAEISNFILPGNGEGWYENLEAAPTPRLYHPR
jgi:hypothetical protein